MTIGAPLWCSELKIQQCHCSVSGHCCGAGSIPGPGNSTYPRPSPEKKKNVTQMNLFMKQKQTLADLENKLMVTKGERG